MIDHQALQAGLVSVKYAGCQFEAVDSDSYKIDQLPVTRLEPVVTEKPADATV